MKANIILGLLIGFTYSCSTSKIINNNDLIGSFYAETGDIRTKRGGYIGGTSTRYYLELSADNVFYFEMRGSGYRPECTGRWEQKGNILFLKCKEENDIAAMLSSDYMNQREHTIKILNKDKLKLGKIILRRKQ